MSPRTRDLKDTQQGSPHLWHHCGCAAGRQWVPLWTPLCLAWAAHNGAYQDPTAQASDVLWAMFSHFQYNACKRLHKLPSVTSDLQ